jgi:hypothetical protein
MKGIFLEIQMLHQQPFIIQLGKIEGIKLVLDELDKGISLFFNSGLETMIETSNGEEAEKLYNYIKSLMSQQSPGLHTFKE